MSHVVRISDRTYQKLEALAKPFVDTSPVAVIDRCVDAMYQEVVRSNGASSVEGPQGKDHVRLNAEAPGELKHTKPDRVVIGGEEIRKPSWNALLREIHVRAHEELGSLGEVLRITGANLREGRFEQNGYYFLRGADFSIQGQDSNLAWENSLRVAKGLSLSIAVEFTWLNKDGATHPGKRGRLEWKPQA